MHGTSSTRANLIPSILYLGESLLRFFLLQKKGKDGCNLESCNPPLCCHIDLCSEISNSTSSDFLSSQPEISWDFEQCLVPCLLFYRIILISVYI